MDLNLAGKTVVVTGGGSNIGRAICHDFAKENVKLAIAELDEAQGQKVAEQAKALGCEVMFVKTDITKNDQVEAMIKAVNDKFGTVDVLVNNVGWNIDDLFMNETREKWEKIIAINFWGMLNCTRAVMDQMIAAKKGAVVNIGSDAGRMGEFREVVYSGCKGGVIGFTKALAREVGKNGIRLNVVCPGLTIPESGDDIGDNSLWAGDMLKIFTPEAQARAAKGYPLRKIGKPDEVSKAVIFMASDCASHITGQTLSVSGGYTMI
ncbi:MAG TPA: short-chain dehydrogenase [Desulfobacteraceae bacterium]|nr:short-chain dehydrogenase [Desulfobacteraceae bacterium]